MKKGVGAINQDEKLEDLEKKVDRNADKIDANAEKIDALADKTDANAEKIDANANKIDELTELVRANAEMILGNAEKTDRNAEKIDANAEKIDANAEKIDANAEMIRALAEMLRAHAEKTDSNFKKVDIRFQNLENWVHGLRGRDLEKSVPQKIGSHLYTKMNLRNPIMLLSPLDKMHKSIMSALYKAGDSGLLTEAECTRILKTDIILKAFAEDGKEIWLALEISATINDDDIERVLQSVDILQRLMGIQAVAAVGGYTISDPQAERAKNSGVEVFIFKSP